jgi:hypothetical protein
MHLEDAERRGRGLFYGKVRAFTCKKLIKTMKNMSRLPGVSGMRNGRDTIVSTPSVSITQICYTPKLIRG